MECNDNIDHQHHQCICSRVISTTNASTEHTVSKDKSQDILALIVAINKQI